jgi:hypothetical protein
MPLLIVGHVDGTVKMIVRERYGDKFPPLDLAVYCQIR